VIDQAITLGRTLKKRKKVQVLSEVDGSISDCIYGDDFRLHQVLNNLISNAVKFTDFGSVKLSVRNLRGGMIEFSVRDTGKGIPKAHLATIFEPFRQVDFTDTRTHGGTGLGLTISKKLVEMMGGTMTVESSEGCGATFIFTLPYEEATKDLLSKDDYTDCGVERKFPSFIAENRTVLVAEDDVVSRKLVQKILQKAGYKVILARNGKEAVEKFESNQDIALILMDVQMPIMDGLTVSVFLSCYRRRCVCFFFSNHFFLHINRPQSVYEI
jgi:anti-sigma regulatory factor (Ser/Thr protein kinase)